MKKKILACLTGLALIMAAFVIIPIEPVSAVGTNYYIDTAGNNNNNGTSPETPWADFTNVNNMNLNAGDQILLKRGCTWTATQSYWYFCILNGSDVTVDAYGTGANPILNGDIYGGVGFRFLNRDDITIQNISFYNMMVISANTYTTYNHSGLTFRNIYLNNAKIGIENVAPDTTGGTLVSDVVIDGVKSENATGPYYGCLNITTHVSGDDYPMAADTSVQNVMIHNVELLGNRKGLMSLCNISNVTLSSVRLYNSSTDYAATGTTAVFLWKTKNLNFINCIISHTANTGSYDQCAVDNEAFIDASQYRGCYFYYNAGAALEFLNFDLEGDYNYNHVVDSCTFDQNATAGSGTYKSSLLAISPAASFQGVAQNNLYYEPTGFTTGNFSNWTLSNNSSINSGRNITNSGWLFGGVQEKYSWGYQSYNGSSWSNMSWDSTNVRYGTASNYINKFETQPSATSSQKTARTYIAPYAGTVNIRGWAFLPYNNHGGDGVRIQITQNGTTRWGTQTISGTNTTGYSTNISDLAVNAGDVIRFEVDCGSSNNNSYDQVSWIPSVAYTSGGNLLTNHSFEESGTSSWTAQYCTITANSTAHTGDYGCLASSRSYTSSSPRQDIKNLLSTYGQGAYKFSAWARLASGSDGMLVVIWINDSNGNKWYASDNYVTIGTTYTALNASQNITWTGTLNSAYIYVQTQSTTGNLYADDFALCKVGNLLSNPGFESGTSPWTGHNCTIATSATAHSGNYGCLTSNRYSTASSPFQDIKGILTTYGKGNYRMSAWARLASGSDGMLVVIWINDSNGNHWYASTGYVTVGTTYTELVDEMAEITWTGTLNSAYIYVQTQSTTGNIYVDDFLLLKS